MSALVSHTRLEIGRSMIDQSAEMKWTLSAIAISQPGNWPILSHAIRCDINQKLITYTTTCSPQIGEAGHDFRIRNLAISAKDPIRASVLDPIS